MASRVKYLVLAMASTAMLPSIALAQSEQSAGAEPQGADQQLASEIIVTAQRRNERLTDVPISVTALSSDDLTQGGVRATGDLAKVTPGLTMDRSGPFSQPTLRGIGSKVTGPGVNTSVATYIDGFYQPSLVSNDFQLADVSSIQVLKGPQGTLFGRNSTGGAILVTTMDPSFDPTAIASVSYGGFNELRASALVGTGLTDTIAAYGSIFYRTNDGPARDIVTGRHDQQSREVVARGKVLFQPTDALRFTLSYTHGDIDNPWGVAQVAYRGISAAAGEPGVVVPDNPFQTAATYRPQTLINYDSVYLTGELDLGSVTLKSYTGYRDEKSHVELDSDKTAFQYQFIRFSPKQETFTQEFNLSSNGTGPLQWVAGLYYYKDKAKYDRLFVEQGNAPAFHFLDAALDTEAYAVFVDGTYEVADRLFVTLGARYNHEKVDEKFASILSNFEPTTASVSFNNFSPRAILRYELTPSASVYASYNRGYKAGTLNASGLSTDPVRPENINAYEVGFKMSRPGTRFEIAGYYYDFQDLQFTSYVGATSRLTNAATARIMGVEGLLVQELGNHFQVSLSAAYTDGEYTSFPGAPRYTFTPPGTITVGPDDASGRPISRTPKVSGRASLDYSTPFADGTLRAHGSFYYQSKVYFDPFQTTQQGGYGLLDGRLSWTDPTDRVTVALWGRNLTNQHYYALVTQQSEGYPAVYGEPRTYGAELSFKF